ncbi:MAG TPA: Wzz/FepE/Etk N-terminal domain-containing protein [Bacteroidia bacterium]|nr:Wzz/FepE/Etk N-terminal domain-containing protein [Bacteroidia bacterium]
MKTEKENSIPIILLYNWRKVILGVTVLAALIATIVTFPIFMPPIFKAEAIIYPPATYSAKLIAEYDLRFGADKEIDEHIQILKSSMLRDSIIKGFDLTSHYNIEPDEDNKQFKLNKLYDENIKVERTRYNSISITVFDEDPKLAAEICNQIIKVGDKVKSFILKQNLIEALDNMQQNILSSSKELENIGEEMQKINGNITLNYNTLTKQKYAERIKAQIDLRDYISKFRNDQNEELLELLFDYEDKLSRFYSLKDSYEQAIQSLNTKIADAYVITPAQIPDKKYAPKRSVIVLITIFASIVISSFIIVARDRILTLKKEYIQ